MTKLNPVSNQEFLALLSIGQLAEQLPDEVPYDQFRDAYDCVVVDVAHLIVIDRYSGWAECAYESAKQGEKMEQWDLKDADGYCKVATAMWDLTHPKVAKALGLHARIHLRRGIWEQAVLCLEQAIAQYRELGLPEELNQLLQDVRAILEHLPQGDEEFQIHADRLRELTTQE